LKRALDVLAEDYRGRGIELAEVSSGYRIQVKRSMSDWLIPLWEERAPRYTRALLETLALIAYRQPITRAEIEEVRGVVVSTNIVRTLLERNWVRVVGHRDVPGKPAMFGTTREFLDYFGLKNLDDLPTLAELKDGMPELSPQTDLIESLEAAALGASLGPAELDDIPGSEPITVATITAIDLDIVRDDSDTDDDLLLDDDDLGAGDDERASESAADGEPAVADDSERSPDEGADAERGAEVIPLRAARTPTDAPE
jgi:segregation and condensation protein B